jgi:hypothetical protein
MLIELATVALTPSVPLAVGLLAIAGLDTAKTPAITSAGRDISTLFKLNLILTFIARTIPSANVPCKFASYYL